MRRGGSLSAGQFAYVDRGGVLVTPGGLGGKGSLRLLGSMVKIGCEKCAQRGSRGRKHYGKGELRESRRKQNCHMENFEEQKQTTL